jgi:hypothetical protein
MNTNDDVVGGEGELAFANAAAEAAWAAFAAQGRIAPGTPGWWQVWGAGPHHIRPGDLVLWADHKTKAQECLLVEDTYESSAAPVRVGLVVDGKRSSLGALTPIIILRQDTRHRLA